MAEAIPEHDLFPVIKLPIEGDTVWPNIMRLMLVGSVVTGILLVLFFQVMLPPERLSINPEKLLAGLTGLIFFEMAIIRRLIIPMNGNYGRYRINEKTVELYPLSTLGFKTMPKPQTLPMEDFKGVVIQPMIFRDGVSRYYVTLAHPRPANSIKVKLFSSHIDANAYAEALSIELNTKILKTLTA